MMPSSSEVRREASELRNMILAGVAVLLAVVGVMTLTGATAETGIKYRDPEVVAAGRALYEEACASCHGAALEGQENWRERGADGKLPAPPHDETGHTWHHPGQQLFEITKYGSEAMVGGGYVSDMRGFEDDLTDADIWAILSYIKSTWPEQIIEMHDKMEAGS